MSATKHKSKATKNKETFYQDITSKVIDLLEQVSIEDYQSPFAGLAAQGMPLNPATDKQYRGINIPCLWFYQQEQGYNSNHWATFKQWQEQGASVRKGEKGSRIVFYKTLVNSEENEQGEEQTHHIPMMKLYTVFNANQVEGYDHRSTPRPNQEDQVQRENLVDEFIKNTGVVVKHKYGESAYYNLKKDFIHMPQTMDFITTIDTTASEGYYSVILHELIHWTGAKHRLGRFDNQSIQNRSDYAKEELVAELGSAMLSAQFNIIDMPTKNSARYIKSWLQALKGDNKYIFSASAQSAKAVDYLNELQPKPKGNE